MPHQASATLAMSQLSDVNESLLSIPKVVLGVMANADHEGQLTRASTGADKGMFANSKHRNPMRR